MLLRESLPGYRAIIGLTGSIASGKSHAREHLASLGAVTLDADRLGHAARLVPVHEPVRLARGDGAEAAAMPASLPASSVYVDTSSPFAMQQGRITLAACTTLCS